MALAAVHSMQMVLYVLIHCLFVLPLFLFWFGCFFFFFLGGGGVLSLVCCAIFNVPSSSAIISLGKKEGAGCFTLLAY